MLLENSQSDGVGGAVEATALTAPIVKDSSAVSLSAVRADSAQGFGLDAHGQVACPPVVLIAFNRPEATRLTLEAVRRARPSKLFLICDGIRPSVDADQQAVTAVRDVLDGVDWECDVRRLYATYNQGCSPTVEAGLDRVFEEVDRAVVLEDDCVPDATFFRYCAEMLDLYEDVADIHFISGFAFDTPQELFGGRSYAVTTTAPGWGWATWKDRWVHHRARAARTVDGAVPFLGSTLDRHFAVTSGYRSMVGEFLTRARSEGLPWDALFALSAATVGGRALAPSVNLVTNVGMGPDATHANRAGTLPPGGSMPFPLTHPYDLAVDRLVSLETEFDALWVPAGRLRTIRRKVPAGLVRRVFLRFMTSAFLLRTLRLIIAAAQQMQPRRAQDPARSSEQNVAFSQPFAVQPNPEPDGLPSRSQHFRSLRPWDGW